jgi:hypothetical protein
MDGKYFMHSIHNILLGLMINPCWWTIDLRIDHAVFHVKDEHGKKLRDQNVINYIQQVIKLW